MSASHIVLLSVPKTTSFLKGKKKKKVILEHLTEVNEMTELKINES